MTTSAGTTPVVTLRMVSWLAPVAVPLLGLVVLLARPELDVHYEHHGVHFWLVLATAAVCLALAVVMLRAVRRRHDARLFLVSLVFQVNAGFLAVHALATPGLILQSRNAGFIASTPVGLVLGSVAALASSAQLRSAAAERLMRWQWLLAALPWVLLGAWTVVTFAGLPPLDVAPEVIETHWLAVLVASAGTVFYLTAAVKYLLLYRRRPTTLVLSVVTAFVLLGEAMLAVALGRSWRLTWWEWHVLMVAAFALIAVSVHVQFRKEGSALGLFDSMTLQQTIAALQRDYSKALEEMVEALRRRAEQDGEPSGSRDVIGAEVAHKFGLTERQVAVLQESAEALGREREQVRKLDGLVAIGERASVIRGELQLVDEVMAVAVRAFHRDQLRLGLVRDGSVGFTDGAPARDGVTIAVLRTLRPTLSLDGATFALPIAVKRKAAGVLEAHRARGGFSAPERALLTSLASQLTVLLENARLYAQLDGLFRSYMSPAVATTLLADPEQAGLGGRVVEVSVLMADLRGFTPFSERSTPEAVVAMLNTYYGAVVPVILEHGGTVVQFVGDAVMAIFNAPARQPDHALRAARAGLGLQRAVDAVAAGRSDWPRFRVGINTGPALVGNIGAAQMRNFTAIGDTTNLAARLEGLAEPGTVVVGATTAAQLGDAVRISERRAVRVAGKRDPVDCFVLEDIRESPAG
jgi:class 3 adenylate cyclase